MLPRALRSEFVWVAIVSLIGFGVRGVRFFVNPISLWLDEAEWAVRLLTQPLLEQAIRPFGFLWLARTSCEWLEPTEVALRLPSFLAGVASVPLSYLAARALFGRSLAALFAALLCALHPIAIDFSREFKPYALEATIHLALLWVLLRAFAADGKRWFIAALALLPLAFPFAYNVVFLYPGVYAVFGFRAWRERNIRAVAAVVASAALALAAASTLFAVVERVDEAAYGSDYWGHKYDVFVVADRQTQLGVQPEQAVDWAVTKVLDLIVGPGYLPVDWQVEERAGALELAAALRWLWIPAFAVGAVQLWKRNRPQALILLVPFVAIVAANALGRWPLGFFRVNLFTLAYSTLIPLAAFSRLGGGGLRSGWAWLPGLLLASRLLALPTPDIKQSWPWMAHSELRRIMERLEKEAGTKGRSTLIADYYSFQSLPYYQRLHLRPVKLSAFRIVRAMTVGEIGTHITKERGSVWVLVSRLEFVGPTRDLLAKACPRAQTFDFGPHHVVARCSPPPAPAISDARRD